MAQVLVSISSKMAQVDINIYRDNMSTLELALNMLAEAITTALTKVQNPKGLEQNKEVAKEGGTVAGNARKDIEQRTGQPVITAENRTQLSQVVTDLIMDAEDKKE